MTITEPTTTGTDTLVELPLDRLAPHPRNIRRHSDVTDLARSIAQVGILEPLIVLPADGAGIHHLVAGHRRARAANQAGLTTAPCIIRNFDDEADVVLAMIGENTNQGRLSIVEEAQALAAVIDLKGGTVTARRLAKAVGHSETWVKSRLSLLALTDAALDCLHDGKLTLDVATALTALADQPDVIDQLVSGNRTLSAWQVESTIRALRHEAALAATSERLTAKGTTVVTEQDYADHARAWRTVDDLLGRDQARSHRSEPCHAVVIKASWDGTTVTEIALCTEPRRHKGNQPTSALAVPSPTSGSEVDPAAEERRQRRAATQARTEWLTSRLATRNPFPTADATRLALLTWLDTVAAVHAEKAGKLLGLDPSPTERGWIDWNRTLVDAAEADPKRLPVIAATLATVVAEDSSRVSGTARPTARRYLDTIETWGYQPTEAEQAQRLTAANEQPAA